MVIILDEPEKDRNFICNDPNCSKFGQGFKSKRSLLTHNTWHNSRFKPIPKDDPVSEFFANYLKEHAYMPKNIFKIYGDKLRYPSDKINDSKKSFRSLINQHIRLGILEGYSFTNYKINKDELIGEN